MKTLIIILIMGTKRPYLDIEVEAPTKCVEEAARRTLQINQDIFDIINSSRERITVGESGCPSFRSVRAVLDPNNPENAELRVHLERGQTTLTREDLQLKDKSTCRIINNAIYQTVSQWRHNCATRPLAGEEICTNKKVINGVVCTVKKESERSVYIMGLCGDAIADGTWWLCAPLWDNQNLSDFAILYLNECDQLKLKVFEPRYRPTEGQIRRARALNRTLPTVLPRVQGIRGRTIYIRNVPHTNLVLETFQRIYGVDVAIRFVHIDRKPVLRLTWPSNRLSPPINYRQVLRRLNEIGEGSHVPMVSTEGRNKHLQSKPHSRETMKMLVDKRLQTWERSPPLHVDKHTSPPQSSATMTPTTLKTEDSNIKQSGLSLLLSVVGLSLMTIYIYVTQIM